jgi:hypothetical protein
MVGKVIDNTMIITKNNNCASLLLHGWNTRPEWRWADSAVTPGSPFT